MTVDTIVGICRFSFLGRGDWVAYRNLPPEQEAQVRADVAAELYAPRRLAFRLWCFENLLLPSIAGQTDPDFTLLVLTSPELPSSCLQRLQQLCQTVPAIRLVVSSERDVASALQPVMSEMGLDIVQFRIDDDDTLCLDYVARLRAASRAMAAYRSYAFSLPRQLILTCYPDEGLRYYEMDLPFHSAGCALKPNNRRRSIFEFGHMGMPRRFVAVTDPTVIGSVQLKFHGHDSTVFGTSKATRIHSRPLTVDEFRHASQAQFPFLQTVDFSKGAAMSLA
ncbi:glycosyltransferase [Falsirhodobacter sp. alg1]|uniref:glycosyltransferase n=1 Tax=Falsirhodobacter sp. alg1 TaxID=1472418 RepID=UPI0007876879|nr:glycosyltransferase [Falsirhodobacter sp. alg1]